MESRQVAFDKLSVGQVSTPFQTSMGVHIVKLEARESGTVLPLATVAPKIKEELQSKALRGQIREVAQNRSQKKTSGRREDCRCGVQALKIPKRAWSIL